MDRQVNAQQPRACDYMAQHLATSVQRTINARPSGAVNIACLPTLGDGTALVRLVGFATGTGGHL